MCVWGGLYLSLHMCVSVCLCVRLPVYAWFVVVGLALALTVAVGVAAVGRASVGVFCLMVVYCRLILLCFVRAWVHAPACVRACARAQQAGGGAGGRNSGRGGHGRARASTAGGGGHGRWRARAGRFGGGGGGVLCARVRAHVCVWARVCERVKSSDSKESESFSTKKERGAGGLPGGLLRVPTYLQWCTWMAASIAGGHTKPWL